MDTEPRPLPRPNSKYEIVFESLLTEFEANGFDLDFLSSYLQPKYSDLRLRERWHSGLPSNREFTYDQATKCPPGFGQDENGPYVTEPGTTLRRYVTAEEWFATVKENLQLSSLPPDDTTAKRWFNDLLASEYLVAVAGEPIKYRKGLDLPLTGAHRSFYVDWRTFLEWLKLRLPPNWSALQDLLTQRTDRAQKQQLAEEEAEARKKQADAEALAENFRKARGTVRTDEEPAATEAAESERNEIHPFLAMLPADSRYDSARDFFRSLDILGDKLVWHPRIAQNVLVECVKLLFPYESEPNVLAATYFTRQDGRGFTAEQLRRTKAHDHHRKQASLIVFGEPPMKR